MVWGRRTVGAFDSVFTADVHRCCNVFVVDLDSELGSLTIISTLCIYIMIQFVIRLCDERGA